MKTGDRVACLTTYEGLVKDKIYIIHSMAIMSCGCVLVDVGIRDDSCTVFEANCGEHNSRYNDWTNTRWYGIERFAPIQTDEFLSSDKIEKSVEEKIDIKLPETIEL